MKNRFLPIKSITTIMSQAKGVLVYPFSILLILVALSSCKKENKVGGQLQPDSDKVSGNVVDTFSIKAKTVKVDSVRSDEGFRTLLGEYYDPVFGPTKASLFLQYRPSQVQVDFGNPNNLTFDSLIMSLPFTVGTSYYGRNSLRANNLDRVSLKVYRATTNVFASDSVYSNGTIRTPGGARQFTYDEGNPVGEATIYTPNAQDTFEVGNNAEPPQLRIKLDSTFGQQLLTAGAGVYDNQLAFVQYLNGLVIVPEDNNYFLDGGQIMFIDPLSSFNRMIMHYRIDDGSGQNAETYEYILNDSSSYFNLYEHDYSMAPFQMDLNDYEGGREKLYIQAMGGTRVTLEIPHIENFFEGFENGVIINRAELLLPVEQNDGYNRIAQLSIGQFDSTRTLFTIPDAIEGTSHLDGFYDTTNTRYRFNVTRYVQNLFLNHESGENAKFEVALLTSGEGVNATRSVLTGYNPTSGAKPKMKIIYTPVN
ncbi:DUF4270 family protein [Salibacter sp.]|uniref:DUF4270 family protein n=1 Tax=Salibacter sp. TaxID=2010995 RepID=UPI0028700582|nr:DUF4270 family protein [Salibacter sp.]MDR9486686.1 DUF4270 family protein [Salibacter sp.]